jgi:hypothetical protein
MRHLRVYLTGILSVTGLVGRASAQARPLSSVAVQLGPVWRDTRAKQTIHSLGFLVRGQWTTGLTPTVALTVQTAATLFPGDYITAVCPPQSTTCGQAVGGPTRTLSLGAGLTVRPIARPAAITVSVVPGLHWFVTRDYGVNAFAPAVAVQAAIAFHPTKRFRPVIGFEYQRLAPQGPGPGPHWLAHIGFGVEGW